MKYGLFTCPYQRLPLEKAFADAAVFGYDYIELWGGRPHAYAPDLLRDGINGIMRLIDQFEIPVDVYTPEHNAYIKSPSSADEIIIRRIKEAEQI